MTRYEIQHAAVTVDFSPDGRTGNIIIRDQDGGILVNMAMAPKGNVINVDGSGHWDRVI